MRVLRIRFSLKSLLVAITGASLIFALAGSVIRREMVRSKVYADVIGSGGCVFFSDERSTFERYIRGEREPTWLQRQFGMSCFRKMHCISIGDSALPGTHVKRVTLQSIGQLNEVDRLHLDWSDVDDEGLAKLGTMSRLNHLSLERTLITDVGLWRCPAILHVETLDLSHTKITDETIGKLATNRSVSDLRLRGTLISDGAAESLSQLNQLVHLDLAETEITDETLRSIANLKSLRRLDVSDTKITDRGLRYVAQIPNLEELQLQYSLANGAGLKIYLRGMKKLKSVVLDRKQNEYPGATEFLMKEYPGIELAAVHRVSGEENNPRFRSE